MWISFLFLVLSHNSSFAGACEDTKIRRQMEPKKYAEELLALCDGGDGVRFSSPDCQKIEACVPAKAQWKRRTIRSEFESPGFAVCEMAGGRAHFIEVFRKGQWHQTDVCFLKPKTFVDNDQLYRYYRTLKP